MMDEDIRPGRWLYVLAVLILAAGIASFVYLLTTNITGIANSNQQMVVPGSGEIVLDKPGEYTIFHEYESVSEGRIYSSHPSLGGLKCSLYDKYANQEIKLFVPWGSSKYEVGGRKGVSVFVFTIDKPGTYVLSAQYDKNTDGPKTVLAVGQGFGGKLLVTIFGGIGILFVSIAAFIIIIMVTSRKRRKNRLELQEKF